MSLNSLHRVLNELAKQPAWETQQQYCRLLEIWQAVVEPEVALQARPLYMARKVLWVATSSSVWAQTLSLKRYSLLKKLNAQLPEPLVDIRFSTAQWHKNERDTAAHAQSDLINQHPSQVTQTASASSSPANTPQSAFEHWAEGVRARSHHLPCCPQCQCATPKGELQRWGRCYHCAAQQWH